MIKLIIFDANRVVYNIKSMLAYFGAEQTKFFKRHNVKNAEKAAALWGDLGKATMLGKLSIREAHKEYLSRLGLGIDLLEEYEKFDREAFMKAELMEPAIKRILLELKSLGCKIAVLSDSGRSFEKMRKMLNYIGVGDIFDKIFVSSEIGHKKPDEEAYNAVLGFFNTPASEALFVGHSADELEEAKRLGMKTVSYKGDTSADFVIQRFPEIPSIVKDL